MIHQERRNIGRTTNSLPTISQSGISNEGFDDDDSPEKRTATAATTTATATGVRRRRARAPAFDKSGTAASSYWWAGVTTSCSNSSKDQKTTTTGGSSLSSFQTQSSFTQAATASCGLFSEGVDDATSDISELFPSHLSKSV